MKTGIGMEIRKILLLQSKSQKWLSEATNINYDKLNMTLNDKRTMSYEDFSKIIRALGVSADELIKQQKSA